jgi:hypothetical protein
MSDSPHPEWSLAGDDRFQALEEIDNRPIVEYVVWASLQ